MQTNFGQYLKLLVDGKFRSRRAFVRAAQPTANEAGAQAYLAKVLNGKAPPPMTRIDAWADALQLTGEERARFLELAREDLLERASEGVQALVKSLRSEVIALREQYEQARAQAALTQQQLTLAHQQEKLSLVEVMRLTELLAKVHGNI